MRSSHIGGLLLSVACALNAAPSSAQSAQSARFAVAPIMSYASVAPTTGGKTFAVEALGGVIGSSLGLGVILLARQHDCDVEDTVCILESLAWATTLATVTSAAGTVLAGRAYDTEPSILGASIGAVAGVAAGLGVSHLLSEELNVINGDVAAVLSYTITQGIVTAVGSRIVRRLR